MSELADDLIPPPGGDATLSIDPRLALMTAGPTAPARGASLLPDDSFQTWSVATPGPVGEAESHGPGAQAAVYEISRLLGRGGFGEVWEARQASLRRTVAIKKLRGDLMGRHAGDSASTKILLGNFEQEALTTACLDHPNIVPVHDLGRDGDGNPVLAMKLVRGLPWDAVLRDEFATLTAEELLARNIPILVDVTQAVAFAHSRCIVHRDLKPSQVMVGRFGEVLLMDWGLAITVDRDATPAERESRAEPDLPSDVLDSLPTPASATNPAGTPAYMAPEQTDGDALRIGPWTDIYLLGGILHQLLTGRPPHAGSSADQAFRIARAGGPRDPALAAHGRHIPEELRTLAMRALEPDVATRTLTAQEFLAGLNDFLSGASRRRESEAIAAEVAAALPSARGYGAFSDLLARTLRAMSLWPNNEKATALHEQVLAAYCGGAIAEGDLALAGTLCDRMASDNAALGGLRARIAGEASLRARRAAQRRAAVAAALILMAVVIVGGGLFTRQVLIERENTAAALVQVQEESARTAEARGKAAAARNDAEGIVSYMLGDFRLSLAELGRLDLLDQATQRSLEYFTAQAGEAETREELVRVAEGLRDVADASSGQGDLTRALEAYHLAVDLLTRAAALDPGDDDLRNRLANTIGKRGAVLQTMGELQPGLADYRHAMEIAEELLQRHPDKASYITTVAGLQKVMGSVASDVGTVRETLEWYRKSCESWARAVELNPAPLHRLQLASSLRTYANYHDMLGNTGEAFEAINTAVGIMEALVDERPDSSADKMELAHARTGKADLLLSLNRHDEAIEIYAASVDDLRVLIEAAPEAIKHLYSLARFLDDIANAQNLAGRPADGVPPALEARDLLLFLTGRDPTHVTWRRELGSAYFRLGQLYAGLARHDEAVAELTKCTELMESLIAAEPGDSGPVYLLNAAKSQLGLVHYHQKQYGEALVFFRESREAARANYERDHNNLQSVQNFLTMNVSTASLETLTGNYDSARALLEEGYPMILALDSETDGPKQVREFLIVIYDLSYAVLLAELGEFDEAFARFDAALEGVDKHHPALPGAEEVKTMDDLAPLRDHDPVRFNALVDVHMD